MATTRYILRFRGSRKSQEDVDRVRALPETKVIDETSPRMLLVEGPGDLLQRLVDSMPGWVMDREEKIPPPGTPRW